MSCRAAYRICQKVPHRLGLASQLCGEGAAGRAGLGAAAHGAGSCIRGLHDRRGKS